MIEFDLHANRLNNHCLFKSLVFESREDTYE